MQYFYHNCVNNCSSNYSFLKVNFHKVVPLILLLLFKGELFAEILLCTIIHVACKSVTVGFINLLHTYNIEAKMIQV